MALAPCNAEAVAHPGTSCFEHLIVEVVATILEFVSVKPVTLFSTLRTTSKLFNQAVALTFERRYFHKRPATPCDGSDGFCDLWTEVQTTVSLRFSFNAPIVFRSFLIMMPMMTEACLEAVEALSLPRRVSQKDFRKLLQAFPNVKHLSFDAAGATDFEEKFSSIILNLPNLETLELGEADILGPETLRTFLSKLNPDVFRRLHSVGSSSLNARRTPFYYVSSCAALFGSLSWLHLETVEFKDEGEHICTHFHNLEGLELVNLSLTGKFFKLWNESATAERRRSLISLELTRNHFSDPAKAVDVEEFFRRNSKLQSLTMDMGTEFPGSWPSSVSKHCNYLRFLKFSDAALPCSEYESLASGLTKLETVHLNLLNDDLCEDRMAGVSRLKNLFSLDISPYFLRLPLSIPPNLKFPDLRRLSIAADALSAEAVLSLIEGAPELRHLTCGGWDEELVAVIADHHPQLQSLSIMRTVSTSPLDLTPVFQRCKNLSAVTLFGEHYAEDLFESLVTHCSQLRELAMYDLSYDLNEKLSWLVERLPRTLSTLVVQASHLSSSISDTVFQSLCNSPSLDVRLVNCGCGHSISHWRPHLLNAFPELVICG